MTGTIQDRVIDVLCSPWGRVWLRPFSHQDPQENVGSNPQLGKGVVGRAAGT
jgi:hypothetical protein